MIRPRLVSRKAERILRDTVGCSQHTKKDFARKMRMVMRTADDDTSGMHTLPSTLSAMPFSDQPLMKTSDDLRWRALLLRSKALLPDGTPDHFLYGVTSTGVVCRPDCASRRPQRKNVHFFDTFAGALAAGFRSCLRCRPGGIAPAQELAGKIDRVRSYIERYADEKLLSLASLAKVAGLSPCHLQRTFRAAMGVSPAEYTRRVRTERFANALDRKSVTNAVYAAGFASPRSVYGKRVTPLGMTPTARKQKASGEKIRYCFADSPLGRIVVAATDVGVCSIAFADTDEELMAELRERFAAATLYPDDAALADAVSQVLESMQEPSTALTFPLHARATAFQERVWKALQEIPRGETRSYAQVAAAIGSPTAARAVARACATNPTAIAVPCHRVVGGDGSLTGYRWGKDRKKRLLQLEGASPDGTRL